MHRFFAIGYLFIAFVASANDRAPNIVIILADDMGYGDARCYNPKSKNPTHNIDQLAREGMRFTDAHAPASFCVPTRYGLLTGRYPHRIKLDWRSRALVEKGRSTIPSALRGQGYATAMVGKWHLGFDGGPKYDYAKPLVGGPLDRGFDSYFGIAHSLDIVPYYYISGRQAVMAPTGTVGPRNTKGWSPIQGEFWRGGPIAPNFKHEEVLPRFTMESVKYIEGRKGNEQPFFLYVALPAPHTPWLPTKKFQGKTNNRYSDFVAMVDDTVGQILGAIDRSKLAKNTLVIFTSDNGPVWYPADTKRFDHSAVTPLRGMKADAWEAGHRMPFIVRWPGKVKANSTSDALICQTDLMATLAALTGRKLADDEGEDSENFLPVLVGQRETARQQLITGTKPTHMAVRQGQYKYIPSLGSGGFSKPSRVQPEPKGPRGQLYNLARDIGETRNLWLDEPRLVESFEKQIIKQKTSGRTRPPMKLFGKLISESAQITTHRLNAEPNDKRFLYYTVSRDGRTLRGKATSRLRSLLMATADSTTRHDEKSHFDPGVLLRFRHGDHTAQVAICFICNKWALYLNGETVSYTSLADDRAAVLAEVKMMFPNDQIIQGIPEKLQ
ncbi:MAG: arylsulfatase [Verrucomicrobia subdivision 3 bacterium]|nr:arylsulfatase [Limisphaerales bacterium]